MMLSHSGYRIWNSDPDLVLRIGLVSGSENPFYKKMEVTCGHVAGFLLSTSEQSLFRNRFAINRVGPSLLFFKFCWFYPFFFYWKIGFFFKIRMVINFDVCLFLNIFMRFKYVSICREMRYIVVFRRKFS